MATLEVHDSRGRVEYVTVTPEKPMLIGADASKCGVVLTGDGVLPIHARLRWKETRYRVEAADEQLGVEVNGRRMLAASFREGDEVVIGPCRLYISGVEAAQGDDRTRVVQPPVPSAKAKPARAPAAKQPATWSKAEVAPPSIEKTIVAQVVTPPVKGKKDRGKGKEANGQAAAAEPVGPPKPPSKFRQFLHVLMVGDQAPGQEKIHKSPLVIGLVGLLVVLVGMSVFLYKYLARKAKDDLYQTAKKLRDDGDFRNAIVQFDAFIKAFPDDKDTPDAKVYRALARVEQYGTGPSPAWSPALEEARKFVDEVSKEGDAYRDAAPEVEEIVRNALSGVADSVRNRAMPRNLPPVANAPKAVKDAEEALDELKGAERLHQRIAGKNHEALLKKGPYFKKKEDALIALAKARFRANDLVSMDRALQAKSPAGVYAARDKLVNRYPDLATDREVVRILTAANELLRKAATLDETQRAGNAEPRPEPMGPPVSLVLRTGVPGGFVAAGRAPKGAVVYALADGFAYGIDGTDGAPLWQVPVGLSSPYLPRPVPGSEEATAIVFDARHNELCRLDGRTGKPLWRAEVGEPVKAPPLIIGTSVVQAVPSGDLVIFSLGDGRRLGALKLGRRLADATPAADDQGQFFYVLADEANLFVVARDPLSCVAVEYNGHGPGSIPCAPAMVGRYLFVTENFELDRSRWSVYLADEQGGKVRFRQRVPLEGWAWDVPATRESVIWSTGDRAGVSAFAVGGYAEREPVKLIARRTAEAAASGPGYPKAPNARELWLSSSQTARYDLDADSQQIRERWTLRKAGPALAPIQVADRLIVLTHQYTEGVGVALWGVDPDTGAEVWRTVLGVPWTVEPAPEPKGGGVATLLADGRPITVTFDQMAKGGFVEQPLPKPGESYLPTGPLRRLEAGDLTVLVPAPDASYLLVRVDNGPFRRVDLPTPLGGEPLVVGKDLFIPGDAGRAYLIDPKTGLSRAEPYVSSFDRSRPVRWKSPALLEGDAIVLADEAGRVRRLAFQEKPRARLVVTAQVDLKRPIVADPASTGGAILLATDDNKIHSLVGRDLSPAPTINLDAPLALGPLSAGDHAFVADALGKVIAFGPEGRRLWDVDLKEPPPIVPPVVHDGEVLLLGREGKLLRRALADGSAKDPLPLDVVAAGNPRIIGKDVVVPVGPGTVRVLVGDGAAGGDKVALP
jgi:TolA-binding protein/outer membrane protein assembly factor BamB